MEINQVMTTTDWRFILNKVRGRNCSGHYNATERTVVGTIAPLIQIAVAVSCLVLRL
jgi:hypothetical protein